MFDEAQATKDHGHVMDWDTCAIAHVRQLFDANDNDSFNGDTLEWNTSEVAGI